MIRITYRDVGRLMVVKLEERLHDGKWHRAAEFFLTHSGWNLLLGLLKPSLSLEVVEDAE